MDQLTRYQDLVEERLKEVAYLLNQRRNKDVQTHCVFDREHGHYLLVNVGWSGNRRVWDATLHVHLADGRIRIEEDWTEEGLATHLQRVGVPKEDIVLAFHPPELRPLTEYAVA